MQAIAPKPFKVHIRTPVPPVLDLIFLGHCVSVPDFLGAVQPEIGLFVDLGRPVGIGGYVGVFECEAFLCGFREKGGGGSEGSEAAEGRMGRCLERHCSIGETVASVESLIRDFEEVGTWSSYLEW